jgi:hypothetical protein
MRGFEKLEAQSHEPCSFESGRKSLKEKKRKVKIKERVREDIGASVSTVCNQAEKKMDRDRDLPPPSLILTQSFYVVFIK